MKDNTKKTEKRTKWVIKQMFIDLIKIAKKWVKTFKKSRILINHVFNVFTFLPFVAKPADRPKNIYRIDAHMQDESTQKKIWSSILIKSWENHVSP